MSGDIDGIALSDLDEAIAHCRPALETLRGARIFITGATGFFGRWILALLARAHAAHAIEAVALSRDPEAFRKRFPALAASSALRFVRGDVRYFEFPKGEFSHIVHAAADTSVAADRDYATLIDTIVGGASRVLEFASSCRARRILYVSSGAIYGAQPDDIDRMPEGWTGACDPLDPRSAYGQAKRMGEQLCACANARGTVEAVIARAFAFVGPGLPLDAHFAIGNFVRDAACGREIVVSGDGTPLRSYLYAADLAAWLVTLLAHGSAGEAYNVGSDEAISIGDLARRVASLAPAPQNATIMRTAEGGHRSIYVPSIERARGLGLDVWTPLDEAIRRTIHHARSQPDAAGPGAPRNEHARDGRLTFVVDVDGVVASLTPGNDYTRAEPLTATVEAINRLHAQGHRIVMFTARGSATGIDWREVTEQQFARWGLRYHELHFGKPAGDYYIDDRLLPISALGRLAEAGA